MAYVDPDKEVEAKKQEFKKELLTNKTIWDHYSDYDKKYVGNAIDSYSLYRARLHLQGNYTHRHHESVLNEWNDRAWFGLLEIQLKKLFDLQCRWRSGEFELENFHSSFDFVQPTMPILDIEEIPRITEKEVDEYLHFLQTPNGLAQIYYSSYDYQEYNQIKEGHMPAYYEYDYTVKSNAGLLSLPDIKGPNEERLIELALAPRKEKAQKKEKEPKKPFKKYLGSGNEVMIEIAQILEEKDMERFIKDLAKWVKEKPDFETEWAMDYLSFCYPEPVPMYAAPTWQEAVEKAALTHITEKVQDVLPGIYEEYLLKKEIGTPIGYLKTERVRKEKPLLLQWVEIGQRIENGEDIDIEEELKKKNK